MAVHPSDSAPALIVLDAKFVVQTPKGERVVDAEDYFVGPEHGHHANQYSAAGRSADGDSDSCDVGGRKVLFRKSARPQCVGFSADECGVGDQVVGNTIDQIRIAVNAASPRPMRLKAVEDAVRGKPANRTG